MSESHPYSQTIPQFYLSCPRNFFRICLPFPSYSYQPNQMLLPLLLLLATTELQLLLLTSMNTYYIQENMLTTFKYIISLNNTIR